MQTTNLPFIHRHPTAQEIEQFRLILSTYQDGSRMLIDQDRTLPGWRDFERSVAVSFNGKALESKWIYDVLLPAKSSTQPQYGISCKMRSTLRTVEMNGRVTIEVSNASGEFWGSLKDAGLTQENYATNPQLAGMKLIQVVEQWHNIVGTENGGTVNSNESFYLVLQWERKSGRYQLFQFPINLPDPTKLHWQVDRRRLIARDNQGLLFEWYGLSGGQLKYYPLADEALWKSPIFRLEPLPHNIEFGIKQKASVYFPVLWAQTQE